jgi:hypothetical protein
MGHCSCPLALDKSNKTSKGQYNCCCKSYFNYTQPNNYMDPCSSIRTTLVHSLSISIRTYCPWYSIRIHSECTLHTWGLFWIRMNYLPVCTPFHSVYTQRRCHTSCNLCSWLESSQGMMEMCILG